MNAKKDKHQKDEALKLIATASHVWAARGKKVTKLDLKKDQPTEDEILKLVLGPTGNLRAPTLIVGKKMIVGFNEEMYSEIFS